MSCEPKCWMTGMIKDGKRQMIAQPGNHKFKSHELHAQCPECFKETMEEAELSILFHGDQKLIEREKQIKAKLKESGII